MIHRVPYSPTLEGKDHINIDKSSTMSSGRFLYPPTPHMRIDSIFGFSYAALVAPLKCLKFKDAATFKYLVELPKDHAIRPYTEYANDDNVVKGKVDHLRASMAMLVYERMLVDEDFRMACLSIPTDMALVSYASRVVNPDDDFVTYEASPTMYNMWAPAAFTAAIEAYRQDEIVDISKAHFVNENSNESWWESIPTLLEDPTEKLTALKDNSVKYQDLVAKASE